MTGVFTIADWGRHCCDAMLRVVNVAEQAGVVAILVHALSDSARQFYLSRGFVESPLHAMTLMMTVATVRGVLEQR